MAKRKKRDANGSTDQPAGLAAAGRSTAVSEAAGQPGPVADGAAVEAVSPDAAAIGAAAAAEAGNSGGSAAVAADGDGAGPDAAAAAAPELTGGEHGTEEPVRADDAEGAAAQGAGDPVEQGSGADAAQLAGDAGDGSAGGAADVDPRDRPEDDGPDAADAFAYGVMGIDWGSPKPATKSEINVACASAVAAECYGVAVMGQTIPDGDISEAAWHAAAAFIRAWPLAPIDALPIHLKLKGFDVPAAGRRELLAWRVFGFVLAQLDEADREEAAETARQAAETEAAKPRGVLRGRLAMKPEDRNPLSQMGKVLQRQKR